MIEVWRHLSDCLNNRLARRVGVATGVAFLLLYLYSVGNIVIAPGVNLAFGRPTPTASIGDDWAAKMWKPVAPFVWEPIGALYLIPSVALFLSVPNLLLAVLLGMLVGLNMAVAIARSVVRVKRDRDFARGFLASLPALLTGFTCCVPTIVLALGSLSAAFSVAAIALAPYFLPFAALALVGNLFCALRQFSCALPAAAHHKRPLLHARKEA
jgi:hypothetical protein